MSKNFFTFVNTPHDPLTISGSDPHKSTSDSNLACWYKVQTDSYTMVHTGSEDAQGFIKVNTLRDFSRNGGARDLNRGTTNIPVLVTGSLADNLSYIRGSVANTYYMMYLRNAATGSANHQNGESSTWIKGPTSDQTNAQPSVSMFTIMKADSDYTAFGRGLHFGFGGHEDGNTNGEHNNHVTFNLGLDYDANESAGIRSKIRVGYDSVNSTARAFGENGQQPVTAYCEDNRGFRCLSMTYHSGSGVASDQNKELKAFQNGGEALFKVFSGSNGDLGTTWVPDHHGTTKVVAIGGDNYDAGGGFSENTNRVYGFAESFVFEDGALSNIRRQQMEAYLCDKYDLDMSSSNYLSMMEGGGGGTSVLTSSLSGEPTGIQTATKVARKFTTAPSYENNIHHETVGGGFVRSSVSGSAFYGITGSSHTSSSLGVSQRAWVRAESINDSNHTGSHVALICKAESPFGHQMDNIKGYALKFGTLKDGYDTESLKFRLSTRDARFDSDGSSSGFGDQDLTVTKFTPTVDEWYQMRLDVLRGGSVTAAGYPERETNVTSFTTNNAQLRAGSGSAWENLFGASSATEGNQTWSVWMKSDGFTNQYGQPMGIGRTGGNPEYGMLFDKNNNYFYWAAVYGGSRRLWRWDGIDLDDGAYKHIVVTSKMASTWSDSVLPELWIDGVNQGSIDSDGSPAGGTAISLFTDAPFATYNKLTIGGIEDGSGEGIYPARIADAAIWNKILTDSEIANLYNNGKITPTGTSNVAAANLVAHYKMNGSGSPIVVQDETSNNNHATAINTNVTSVSETLSGDFVSATTDGVDTVEAFVRKNGGDDWEKIHSEAIDNTANNFRYWKDDSGYSTTKVKYPTGIHNGYYVAMSSSNGQRLATTYYIDNYSIQTSGSNDLQ